MCLGVGALFTAPINFEIFNSKSPQFGLSMVDISSLPGRSLFKSGKWPGYRGTRAGKQVKDQESHQLQIQVIASGGVNCVPGHNKTKLQKLQYP